MCNDKNGQHLSKEEVEAMYDCLSGMGEDAIIEALESFPEEKKALISALLKLGVDVEETTSYEVYF